MDRQWPSEHDTVRSAVEKQCHVTGKTSLRTGKGVLYKIELKLFFPAVWHPTSPPIIVVHSFEFFVMVPRLTVQAYYKTKSWRKVVFQDCIITRQRASDPVSKLGQALHLQACPGTVHAVQGVSPACRVYANLCGQKGAPTEESRLWGQPGDNSQKGGCSKKGLCLSTPSLQTILFPVLFPLPSPPVLSSCYTLPSPILPSVSLYVSISLFLSLFFLIFQFLKCFLRV